MLSYLHEFRELLKATDWSKFEICHSVSLLRASDDLFSRNTSIVFTLDTLFAVLSLEGGSNNSGLDLPALVEIG